MINVSMDDELHASQLAANQHQGARQSNGRYDIADAPTKGTFWRDSHDAGGPHAPFDLSDETDQGAPRGQTQYFSDPTSALANMPLGRQDLTTLVDPYALEMDQDYDCVHNSNPSCSYTRRMGSSASRRRRSPGRRSSRRTTATSSRAGSPRGVRRRSRGAG